MKNSQAPQDNHADITDSQLLDEILRNISDQQIEALLQNMPETTPTGAALRQRLAPLGSGIRPADAPTIRQQIKEAIQTNDQFRKSFFQELDKMMQKRRMKDSELYNKIGISQPLWVNIRNKGVRDYGTQIRDAHTKRENVLKMAIVLEADYYELYNLMCYGGFAFSPSTSIGDYIIACCVKAKIYKPNAIDKHLEEAGLPPLFCEA